MKLIIGVVILLNLSALPMQAQKVDSPTITEAELIRRTNELYAGLPAGDAAPWKRYLADDAMVFDEKGRDFTKAQQIEDVQPFPAGYTGNLAITSSRVRIMPGLAVVSYDQLEHESIFGQPLTARYHTTDTWVYRNQLWQILASQTLRYYEDPAAVPVPPARLDDYVGKYELAAGNVLTIQREGGVLYSQRGTAARVKMLAESVDLFFRPGVEGRRLFHRDAAGRVDEMIDRRNNEDLVWKRIS